MGKKKLQRINSLQTQHAQVSMKIKMKKKLLLAWVSSSWWLLISKSAGRGDANYDSPGTGEWAVGGRSLRQVRGGSETPDGTVQNMLKFFTASRTLIYCWKSSRHFSVSRQGAGGATEYRWALTTRCAISQSANFNLSLLLLHPPSSFNRSFSFPNVVEVAHQLHAIASEASCQAS